MENGKPQGLEAYLRRDYRAADAELREIRALVNDVLKVFARTFDQTMRTWRYQLVNGIEPPPPGYSSSTTAMIAFALGLGTGRIRSSLLVPANVPIFPEDEAMTSVLQDLSGCIDSALDGLIKTSRSLATKYTESRYDRLPDPRRKPPLVYSSTFGWDDPFTITWLLELLANDSNSVRSSYRRRLAARGSTLLDFLEGASDPTREILQIRPYEQVPNSFPLLRTLQLGEFLGLGDKAPISRSRDLHKIEEILRLRVHEYLSQATISDSGFDAADLVFSLEAWILSNPVRPDEAVVDRVFEIIRERQEATPYWRPLRPFKITQAGLALLPQSVEVANSLLRICNWSSLRSVDYFAKNLELFGRYTNWLIGRVFRGFASPDRRQASSFVGWESEHTYTLNSIHLWQTSQAIIYLGHYAAMLQRHIERVSLSLAGFSIEPTAAAVLAKRVPMKWREFAKSEPITAASADSPYRAYKQIQIDFIIPRLPQATGKPSFSMLLYGPPGTGKSTLAKRVSEALGFRFIKVTPSDFIAGGGEQVESRAKSIFAVLEDQTKLVVLFDEIDHLMLDRDSQAYRNQGDFFQLLTPGMLTKLNDLADRRRVLFVIATNYYESIDRAIKRPGRIDARYLILPPCKAQRSAYLSKLLTAWSSIPTKMADIVVASTVHFTYKELEDLVAFVDKHGAGDTGEELGSALLDAAERRPPTIKLEAYKPRFGYKDENGETTLGDVHTVDRPWEEFALLAYLELEAHGRLPDQPWMATAVRHALNSKAVLDSKVAARLNKAVSGGVGGDVQ